MKQGKLIVTGDQFIDKPLAYIVDGLRMACGNQKKRDQTIETDDQNRVLRVSKIYSQNSENLVLELMLT